ncbi:four helix bundle protein [Patescibacteria group bacterium]|nr:four helix bundle protein [Patescibacteria group bacterium]MBU1123985.1 four helix bundle protein [Patescibacteria group bacterium]MBU1910907.1 four helix bundle protein [Patescibacteria group bacterium]
MSFKRFEDINVWCEARELNKLIVVICKRTIVKMDKNWIDQISRSVLSVVSNIAEGNDSRSDVEFIQFLGYAKRSAAESRSQIYYAFDRGYISKVEFDDMLKRANKISKQISALMNYLHGCRKGKRYVKASTE